MAEAENPDAHGAQFWGPLELLWDEALSPDRSVRRSSGLDRDSIVRAAIAVADADGLDAVSMRRVAQELGAGTMALYRHVPDKNALVGLMIEQVLIDLDEDDEPPAARDWRAMMIGLARSSWDLVQQHPWYAEASMVRPQLTPRSVAGLEWALSAFDAYDLRPEEAMTMVGAVHSTVIARALSDVVEQRTRRAAGLASEREVQAAGSQLIQRILSTGRYPRLGRFVLDGPQDPSPEDRWLPTVELICDGIEARLTRQPAG